MQFVWNDPVKYLPIHAILFLLTVRKMLKCRNTNWSDVSDVSMGVSVLQIYPAQPDKTGPQIIDTLTRRIMNLGELTSISEVKQI